VLLVTAHLWAVLKRLRGESPRTVHRLLEGEALLPICRRTITSVAEVSNCAVGEAVDGSEPHLVDNWGTRRAGRQQRAGQ
jgi:hypothetical protein